MSIKSLISRLFSPAREVKAVGALAVGGSAGLLPASPYGGYSSLLNLAQTHDIIAAGIRYIGLSMSQGKLVVVDRDGNPQPDHPVQSLLSTPNQYTSGVELVMLTVQHLYLAGEAIWEIVRSPSGRPSELWVLQPDKVKLELDRDGLPARYAYIDGSRQYPISVGDIVHIRYPSPAGGWRGYPILRGAMERAMTDREAKSFIRSILANYAIPPAVISFRNPLSGEQVEMIRAEWQKAFSGQRVGSVLLTSDVEKVDTISISPDDLALPAITREDEARICAVMGIPPILLGLSVGLEHATYSNYEQARQAFWEDTILPLQDLVDDYLNLAFRRDYPDIIVQWDNSEVEALQAREQSFQQRMLDGLKSGIVTVNEGRRALGLPPVPNGDIFLRPLSIMSAGTGEKAISPQPPVATKAAKKPIKQDPVQELRLIGIVYGTMAQVERWYDHMHTSVMRWLKGAKRDLREAVKRAMDRGKASEPVDLGLGEGPLTPEEIEAFMESLSYLRQRWQRTAQGDLEPVYGGIFGDTITGLGTELGVEIAFTREQIFTFIREHSYRFTHKISQTLGDEVRSLFYEALQSGVPREAIVDELMKLYSKWSETHAEMIARTEVLRAFNAGSNLVYQQAGYTEKRWYAASGLDVCPFCEELDGKVVAIEDRFLSVGDTLHAMRGDKTMEFSVTYEDVEFPPLHPHCRCTILPVEVEEIEAEGE